MTLTDVVNHPEATIVDVRTEGEFAGGSVAGSINIPLNTIPENIEKLKGLSKPLVFCCASGGRSGQATMFSANQGVTEVYNGGGWTSVQYHRQ